MKKLRLAKPDLIWNSEIEKKIKKIINSGFFTEGQFVKQFENTLKNSLNKKGYVVVVNSGTSALLISLIISNIKSGDEVIAPVYTFPATINVIEFLGAKPVLVDVNEETFNVKIEEIERKICERTKAILPVHLFGNPCEIEEILKITKKFKLKLIEDSAGAFGSLYKNMKCGTFGDFGCFSFHPRKLIVTGEGGAIFTKKRIDYEKIKMIKNHGFNEKKDIIFPGLNFRICELNALLGDITLKNMKAMIKWRKNLFEIYKFYLRKIEEVRLQKILPYAETNWQAFVIKLKRKDIDAKEVIEKLKKTGIETTVGSYAIHLLKYYKEKYNFSPYDFPVGYELSKKLVALPFNKDITEKDVKKITEKLKEILK